MIRPCTMQCNDVSRSLSQIPLQLGQNRSPSKFLVSSTRDTCLVGFLSAFCQT
uniref:Uncharacterized protein n=1 Tax=Oryza brachyantha TaxID=4533 RepID=J3MY59_ORYBR